MLVRYPFGRLGSAVPFADAYHRDDDTMGVNAIEVLARYYYCFDWENFETHYSLDVGRHHSYRYPLPKENPKMAGLVIFAEDMLANKDHYDSAHYFDHWMAVTDCGHCR